MDGSLETPACQNKLIFVGGSVKRPRFCMLAYKKPAYKYDIPTLFPFNMFKIVSHRPYLLAFSMSPLIFFIPSHLISLPHSFFSPPLPLPPPLAGGWCGGGG
jgi:hypothetical protein